VDILYLFYFVSCGEMRGAFFDGVSDYKELIYCKCRGFVVKYG